MYTGKPVGRPVTESRVLRGGSWANNQHNARADNRNNNHPNNRNDNNGFRVVCASHIHLLPSGCWHVPPITVCGMRRRAVGWRGYVLLEILAKHLHDNRLLDLATRIIASGNGVLDQEYSMVWFPDDDLLAACRPRGLPIGNLTSQFWSNCFLHPLDQFITRELGCRAYLRYVDDMALFADSKAQLWAWKRAIMERLVRYRLTLHENSAQVAPVTVGIPWLGFVIYPFHRRVKARKVMQGTRHLTQRFYAWRSGRISFAEFDASVSGWINHVRYADSWVCASMCSADSCGDRKPL